jgi:c-di-GMP-binding flagellar brake protein YcgR
MVEKEVLKTEELKDVLTQAVDLKTPGVMSYLSEGKWHTVNVFLTAVEQNSLHFELSEDEDKSTRSARKDQPVGISMQHEFNKYVFETVVLGKDASEVSNSGKTIHLGIPDKIEKMQRRSYVRVPVPAELKVKALFWHRGYNDEAKKAPDENYWQGRLLDLSAGGLQVVIEGWQRSYFNVDQFIGLQFTPMSYQKPIVLEGQIKHIQEIEDGEKICIGAEFLGLEASNEGRKKLRRLAEVVNTYQNENEPAKENNVVLN